MKKLVQKIILDREFDVDHSIINRTENGLNYIVYGRTLVAYTAGADPHMLEDFWLEACLET